VRILRVAAQELIDVAGVYVMLGASGAGKTTTVAKLAARYVMKYGRDALVLVTTDRYRLAGAPTTADRRTAVESAGYRT
jgi:flagellar biosynthesis protein FlhF